MKVYELSLCPILLKEHNWKQRSKSFVFCLILTCSAIVICGILCKKVLNALVTSVDSGQLFLFRSFYSEACQTCEFHLLCPQMGGNNNKERISRKQVQIMCKKENKTISAFKLDKNNVLKDKKRPITGNRSCFPL